MSRKLFNPVLRCVSLSCGAAFLVSNTVVVAAPDSQPDVEAADPVVVETEEESTQTSTSGDDKRAARFSCELMDGQYTVMYYPESQPNQSFAWATPTALGGGWSAERRCNEISRRLEFYRPEGLQELRTARENNYNIVCVTTEKNPACQIVLTVPPGQDPMLTRDRVFQNLTIADSGKQTQAVNTFVDGGNSIGEIDNLFNLGRAILGGGNNSAASSDSINLRPFLDPADGGTGTQLRGVSTRSNSRRLNPSNFR